MSASIEAVLRRHTPELMAIPGVVGTGQGTEEGRPAILVLVARLTPDLERRVPRMLDGFAVVLRETGEVRGLGRSR